MNTRISPHAAPFALLLLILAAIGCAKSPAADAPPTGGTTSAASATASPVEEGCPKDLLAAKGTPCKLDGKVCTGGAVAFTHLLMCSGGKWIEMDAPPPPPPPTPR